jgi:hypothetical protein
LIDLAEARGASRETLVNSWWYNRITSSRPCANPPPTKAGLFAARVSLFPKCKSLPYYRPPGFCFSAKHPNFYACNGVKFKDT